MQCLLLSVSGANNTLISSRPQIASFICLLIKKVSELPVEGFKWLNRGLIID